MLRLSKIIEELEIIAPSSLKCDWDNVGLLVGDENQKINRIFLCLDITGENVKAAADFGADLIISHHPLIFDPLKSIAEGNITSSIIRTLIQKDISAFCMHTNFDNADGGMNDLLAQKLGLENIRKFTPDEAILEGGEKLDGIGRVGILERPMLMSEFISHIKASLGSTALKYSGDLFQQVQTVALCSGSGGSELFAAYNSGADVFVTADLKHDHGRIARELGLNIIDAGHFETENLILEFMSDFFYHHFPEIEVKLSESKPYFRSL